ncbi:MAG: nicotinate-nucleotide--dimethylbenzimidazole phosphoribosyltransferase [Nitratireductor sp.]|nr:nicotinate-nucleotide--dimethylbenzimidazole phosphoribosyltransferase [Nitratireductor sp.]
MQVTGLPFDDIRTLAEALPPPDAQAAALADARSQELTRLLGPMATEARLARWLAGWSGKSPAVERPLIALFAGTHGCGAQSRQEDTLAGVTRLAAGGSAVNQVCGRHDIGLKVFDLALQVPVGDITGDEALDEKGSAATIGYGMEAIAGGVDLLGLAAFGRGGEIANAALLSLLLGNDTSTATALAHLPGHGELRPAVEAAVARHAGAAASPLELLRRLGGREHSALAGALLAARVDHVPVVLSGTTALVVALLLDRLRPGSCQHCLVAGGDSDGLAGRVAGACGMPHVLPGHAAVDDGSTAAIAIGMLAALAAMHGNMVVDVDSA